MYGRSGVLFWNGVRVGGRRGGGDVGIRKSDLGIDGEDWEGVEMEGWEDVDRLECLRWIEMGKMGTDSR